MQTDGLHPGPQYIRIFRPLLFPDFLISLTVLPVSVRDIFSVFHTDHGRWLSAGELSSGSFHSCKSCPFIPSFHRSILVASGVCDRLIIVVFKTFFFDSSRLSVSLPPYARPLRAMVTWIVCGMLMKTDVLGSRGLAESPHGLVTWSVCGKVDSPLAVSC